MRALLLIAVAGCATSLAKTPVGDDFTELAGKGDVFSSKMKLLGTLEFGQNATADYHAQPRYIAYQMFAGAGERVVIDVTSPTGDSVAWLLDSSFHIVAVNDDASDGTLDSHLDVTLPAGDVTYYVVV